MRAFAPRLALALLVSSAFVGAAERQDPSAWCEPQAEPRCPAVFKYLVEQGYDRDGWEGLSPAQRGKLHDASLKEAEARQAEVQRDFERAQASGKLDAAKEKEFRLWLGPRAVDTLRTRSPGSSAPKAQAAAGLKSVDALAAGPNAGAATAGWLDGSKLRPGEAPSAALGSGASASIGREPSPDELRAAIAARGAAVPELKLNALADTQIAPPPTMMDRLGSAMASDGATVKEDLRTIRSKMENFTPPPENSGSNSAVPDAPREFFNWLKTAKDEDLPKIHYGVLEEGKLAEYQRGVITKTQLTVNYHLLNEPPEARSAAVVHELYHYWDNEVAKNFYEDSAYGHVAKENIPNHEYDAYYVTAQYWKQAKPSDPAEGGKLPAFLDRLPAEPDKVREMVDQYYGAKK